MARSPPSGAALADIFLGKITHWNDSKLAALNPGVTLPTARITVVHRADGSGTTFNLANYLAKVSPAWKAMFGDGAAALEWPTGIGGKGNEGVAAYVRTIKHSIGYVELAYVLQTGMAYTKLVNAAGKAVAPNAESFQAAAASADWSSTQDFHLVFTGAPGEASWPITATTFVLMYNVPKDPARTTAALRFFRWALESGQSYATPLHYIPLPEPLVAHVKTYWSEFAPPGAG